MSSAEGWDLVVAGAGTAGLACAIAAGEAGGRVLLVEKSERIGGTLHVTGGQMSGAGTRLQHERGIEDSPELHAADVLRINHGTGRSDLIALATRHAAATIDWLVDAGLEIAAECPAVIYVHEPYSVARTYWAAGGGQGRAILAALARRLDPLLAAGLVRLELETRLAGLLRAGGEEGATSPARVVGVTVAGPGGAEQHLAPATVLTCGGYSNDEELFGELHGRPLYSAGMATSTGDGFRIARAAGGRIVNAESWMPTFGGLPGPIQPQRVQWGDRPVLRTKMRLPWEIYVRADGCRFVAEDEESIDAKERALQRIDDLTFFTVFDDEGLERSDPIVAGWSAADLRARAGRRAGVFAAPDLAGLAAVAGIDPTGLATTVRRYNDAVSAGGGDELGRSFLPAPIVVAPFYALENHGITLSTFAGIDVAPDLAVLGPGGEPIPGLYAAGEMIGSGAMTGNAFCSGMVITPTLTFGRLLGERLAGAGITARRAAATAASGSSPTPG